MRAREEARVRPRSHTTKSRAKEGTSHGCQVLQQQLENAVVHAASYIAEDKV